MRHKNHAFWNRIRVQTHVHNNSIRIGQFLFSSSVDVLWHFLNEIILHFNVHVRYSFWVCFGFFFAQPKQNTYSDRLHLNTNLYNNKFSEFPMIKFTHSISKCVFYYRFLEIVNFKKQTRIYRNALKMFAFSHDVVHRAPLDTPIDEGYFFFTIFV